MKKLFTLFALLSVGLSAWAETYVLHCGSFEYEFDYVMNDMKDGTYSLTKLVYLISEGETDEDGFVEETEYPFQVYDINDYETDGHPKAECDFNLGTIWPTDHSHFDRETGWYALTFTFNSRTSKLTITENKGTVEVYEGNLGQTESTIHFSDDLSFAMEGTLEQELEGVSIIYTRSKCNQWGTLCLPFNFLPNQSNVTFYQIESVADGVMTFAPFDEYENGEISQIGGGESVVFKLDEEVDELVVSNTGATPYIAAAPEPFCIDDDWTMHGTFESVNSGSNSYYYYIANRDGEDGVFYGTNITVPPYRAWFTGPTPSGAPLRIAVNDTEGLQIVEQEDGTVKVSYDLQGRKLDEARKGLMIENGKVIMVK